MKAPVTLLPSKSSNPLPPLKWTISYEYQARKNLILNLCLFQKPIFQAIRLSHSSKLAIIRKRSIISFCRILKITSIIFAQVIKSKDLKNLNTTKSNKHHKGLISWWRYYYSQFFLKMQIFDVFFLCFSKLLFSTAISFMIFGLIF